MTKENCAVFSCLGLGDGVISLVLSENLYRSGRSVTTYHPFLDQMQLWFPHHPIFPFPPFEEIPETLSQYDRFFIFYEKTPWMHQILLYCQNKFPDKTMVLNPIATPNQDYAFWETGKFDGRKSFVENLFVFARDILGVAKPTKSNGAAFPEGIFPRRHLDRVAIHPKSSKETRNWPKEKFLLLAKGLKERGYFPAFIMTPQEKKQWGECDFEVPDFFGLHETAEFIAESGFLIGNDSGMVHLASCLGVPTITIARNQMRTNFWRPAWSPGAVLTPLQLVPNLKGMRLRDKYWKKWISVRRVLTTFDRLEASLPSKK